MPTSGSSAQVARALLRGVLAGVIGLVVYAVVPVRTGPLHPLDALVFAGALLGFALATAAAAVRERQAALAEDQSVAGARIEHVLAIVLWAIAFFALAYLRLAGVSGQFEGIATRVDALYFTLTTLTTVGYGDINAIGQTARVVVMLQMVFNVVVIAAAVRLLLIATRRRRQH